MPPGHILSTQTKTPVQKAMQIKLNAGDASQVSTIYTVPAGYHMVVEYASIQGSLPPGQVAGLGVLTTAGGDSVLHFVTMASNPYPTKPLLGAGQVVQLYADPGSEVQIQWWRSDNNGEGELTATISGYLFE